MRRRLRWAVGLFSVFVMVGGCSLSTEHDSPKTPPTYTIASIPSTSPSATQVAPLVTDTGPYENTGALLDGVCFEFLVTLNGTIWVWTTPDELAAFYDGADSSGLCPAPVLRASFDFSGYVLAGAVQTSTGCDAAFHVLDTITDTAAQVQTITVQLKMRGSCEYELLQPLLISVPTPPRDYTLQLVLVP